MQRVKWLVLVAVSSISACVHQPQAKPPIQISWSFDEKAAEEQIKDGSGTVVGNGFMRQQGGGVVTCAGSDVHLIPDTNYANERLKKLYGSDIYPGGTTVRSITDIVLYGDPKFEPDPVTYRLFMRRTSCDAQGNFSFERVKHGRYYVVTGVLWQVGNSRQGGAMATMVNVTDDRPVKVIMSR